MAIKVLVAYTTNAGSTAEVAQVIGQELSRDGAQVDVRRFREIEVEQPLSTRLATGAE